MVGWPGTWAGVWSVGGGHRRPRWVQHFSNPGISPEIFMIWVVYFCQSSTALTLMGTWWSTRLTTRRALRYPSSSCKKRKPTPSFHFPGGEGDLWEACGFDWQPCRPTSPCEYLRLILLFNNLSLYYKVGNKSDLHAERAVSEATGKKLAADMKVILRFLCNIFK